VLYSVQIAECFVVLLCNFTKFTVIQFEMHTFSHF